MVHDSTPHQSRCLLLLSFKADGSEQAQVTVRGPVTVRRIDHLIRMLELTRENLDEPCPPEATSTHGAA
jgi:hypothetical protein